jgi:GR25 family glycosyltransferase involved in LPS biosynthesis
MNIAYKVFHTPGIQKERDESYNKINSYLSSKINILDTPTIKISSEKDYVDFLRNNPKFIINKDGYELGGESGWRFGEIGILASNWTAWCNFINSQYDYLILMEDDIKHNDFFYERLTGYILQLPLDFDVFSAFVPRDQFAKHDVRLNISEGDISLSYQDWSCLCYVISKEGAKKLINDFYNVSLPLDWYIYRQTDKFNVYALKPTENPICDLIGVESSFQTKESRRRI